MIILGACNPFFESETGAEPVAVDLSDPTAAIPEIAGYTSWTRLNDEPRNVAMFIWTLCRLPSDEEMAFADSEHGSSPDGRYLNDYVNDAGLSAMMDAESAVFPAGTVIVKEKFTALEGGDPVALGVMIKREAGFNPDGGDWEYIYWEQPDTFARGTENLAHCQACHVEQAPSDSVFRPYVAGGW